MKYNLLTLMLAIVFNIATFKSSAATKKVVEPDFAFPETVIKDSETTIDKALASGNEKDALRALLNYSLAESSIGTDNWQKAIDKIRDTEKKLRQPQSKALADLMLATLYQSIYQANKFVYDERKLPIFPLSADYREWSGEQFRNVITELCDKSLSSPQSLQEKPITDYENIVNISKDSRPYFPSLYDFIAYRTIDIRSSLSPFSSCMGILSLSPRTVFMFNPGITPASEQAQKILDTYAALLAFHKNQPAPEVICDIHRLQYVSEHLYGNLSEKGKALKMKRLVDLYEDYKDSEYSGNVLIALSDAFDEEDFDEEDKPIITKKQLYNYIEQNLQRFPNFALSGCLKNMKRNMEIVNISLYSPATVAPDKSFDINVHNSNSSRVIIDIYDVSGKISPTDNWMKYSALASLKPINSVTLSFDGNKVPFKADTTISLSLPRFGYYAIVQRDNQNNRRNGNTFQVTRCTELSASLIESVSDPEMFVINPLTGCPVEKSDIKYFKRTNRSIPTESTVGKTDANGFFNLKNYDSGNLQPVKGQDKAAAVINYWKDSQRDEDWRYACNAYTDLAIYHPGDTAKWCAVIYERRPLETRIAEIASFDVILLNANSVAVDTVSVTSDEWGRINGSFTIPTGELTGNYRINIKDKKGKFVGSSVNFMVSDYKMPTYYVKLDKAASGIPNAGDVTISGVAKTYSGVAVANSPVMAVISVSTGRWWFRSNEVEFCTLRDTTDTSGRFKMVLTKQMIENSPAPEGIFNASVAVTSLSGESQQASVEFNVGTKYVITSRLPNNLEVSKPINLSKYLEVISSEGKPVSTPLEYKLYDFATDKLVMSGPVTSAIDWSKLKGTSYDLVVKAVELDADSMKREGLILYRDNDDYSPVNNILWYPGDKSLTIDGYKTSLNVFALENDTYVLYYLNVPKKSTEKKWLRLKKGANRIEVKLPERTENANLTLLAVKNFKSYNIKIDLTVKESQKALHFIAESFRDKLVPGQGETWTFRTLDIDSAATQSAVILDMYNKALDALVNPHWSIDFTKGYWQEPYLNAPYFGSINNNYRGENTSGQICREIEVPSLQTYGRTFSPVIKLRGMLYGVRAEAAVSADGMPVVNEMKMETEAESPALEEVVVTGYGSAKKSAMTRSVSSPDEATDEDAGDVKEVSSVKDKFEYRESNSTLAFFAPTLTTDDQGRLTYSFNVPNANTTWSFNALAYDRNLVSTSFTKDIMANKPIMVQPNLPRFLRSGDEATVISTIMNNSEEEQNVTTSVELFDPANNNPIGNPVNQSLVIKAGESKTVSITIEAPAGTPFIGFRVKASNGNYSDGEQSMIPVLAASSPVIETIPFYVSPDSINFTMTLPEYSDNARITLQYCDNPTWYVVTALPGISAKEARTSPEAASAIFSAAVSDGILRTYPQVRTALKEWSNSNKSDSTLVSMLERNSDLKTFMLQATPWMLDARSDTERMQRLALLFDDNNIRETYSKNIALLKKLQRANGGWAWINQYEKSSEWATEQTLSILGRLNRLGFLPVDKNLIKMTDDALAYLQGENEKLYGKYPKSDFTDYVMLLDYWPSFKPSLTSNSIISKTVQRYVAGWKKMTLIDKTTAALLFYRHGYKPLAKQVLLSLSQFAKTSPTQGMWWPLLDDFAGGTMTQLRLTSQALEAYNLIYPSGKEIDAIRQWLILQKEARDWGNGTTASDVAASILLTSPKWVSAASPAEIFIGKNQVRPSKIEKTLGYFRTDISSMRPSRATLKIEKSSLTPAWGAVYSQSTEVMKDVKSSACEAVSIEKRIYKQIGDKWTTVDKVNVGDKVRIELLIHSTKAMDYVAISDERAACFEPVEQLPTPIFAEGLCFYRENNDEATNIFISNMPKGTYLLTYDMWVNNAGDFSSGVATIQSQYAPQLTAHSAGSTISVNGN